jgi:hypothetical protein
MASMERHKIEHEEGWRQFSALVPLIPMKRGWMVAVVPPFGGAASRFFVRTSKSKHSVSVYLNKDNSLGCWEGPYWEVYPYDGDIFRCDMADVDALVKAITKSLKEQRK